MRIAFVGPIGSGKTTMSRALSQKTGGMILSFASELKQEVTNFILDKVQGKIITNIPQDAHDIYEKIPLESIWKIQKLPRENTIKELLEDRKTKEDFREILQWWGTEFRRKTDDNYWINKLQNNLNITPPSNLFSVFVDDCRFKNEYTSLIKNDFIFIKLAPNPDFISDSKKSSHASETDWKKFKTKATLDWKSTEERVHEVINNFK